LSTSLFKVQIQIPIYTTMFGNKKQYLFEKKLKKFLKIS